MKCSELQIGEKGIFKNIWLDEVKKAKLFHLGLVKGALITCKFKSPFKTPIAYQINGCVFAMRDTDASCIEVEK